MTIGRTRLVGHGRADTASVGQPTGGSAAGRRASGVRYTAAVLPAAITFRFDPLLHLGDWTVRWETLAIAGALLVGLVVAALLAGRSRIGPGRGGPPGPMDHLRRDDILFIAVGIVPGAVPGGRLADVVLHLDYYSA